MGPSIDMNTTAEKEKEFLACIENVYPRIRSYYRGIQLLKDERIICYDYYRENKIKIYKYIDKKFILDFEFKIENEEVGATSLYEIEENIIIFGGYKKIFLYDIRNNIAKQLQTIEIDFLNFFSQIIELSNGLIATHNTNDIIFFKYDRENKKLEKKDEIKCDGYSVTKIFETKNGNIISFSKEIIFYGKDKSIQSKMKLNQKYHAVNVLDGKYILISYINDNQDKYFVDVYDINKLLLKQTLEVKYDLRQFIRLNDNLIVASDNNGNIIELNIDNNDELSVKDIFRAHECPISQICKFDDNKLLSISHDGTVKLWEFN